MLVTKSTLARGRAAFCGLTAAIFLISPALADAFSPPQSKATLTITYRLTGEGVDRPDSHERDVTWSVDDRYTVQVVFIAQPPMSYGSLHKLDAGESANLAGRQAAAQAAAGNMQGMMEQAQAIMEKCGDDEACIQQETIKMSQQIDPNSAELQAAKQNMEQASIQSEMRYQAFASGPQSGTYQIVERAHEAYFDAACSLRNETPCAYETSIQGAGKLLDGDGNTTFTFTDSAEVDTKTGSFILGLPSLGFAKATKTVQSKNPQIKTGKFDEIRRLMNDPWVGLVEVSCGECRTASGTITRDVSDELLGRPAKLVIDWKFARQ